MHLAQLERVNAYPEDVPDRLRACKPFLWPGQVIGLQTRIQELILGGTLLLFIRWDASVMIFKSQLPGGIYKKR